MHGFCGQDKLKRLAGAKLIQICFGTNEVILNFFPEDIRVTILSINSFLHDNIDILWHTKKAEHPFDNILNAVIENIDIASSSRLEMLFSTGALLIIEDDTTQYESVIVKIGEETLVI